MQQTRRNPWKTLGLGLAVSIPALLVTGAVVGMLEDDRRVEELAVVVADAAPPASVADECNRYAADVGGAPDASSERAPAAPTPDVSAGADGNGQHVAAGRSRGTLVGMSEQNSRSPAARQAFRDCMRRKGYGS